MAIHPGAAIFSQATREAVANGPLFDDSGLRADGCCLVAALIRTEWPDDPDPIDGFPMNDELVAVLKRHGVVTADPESWERVDPTLEMMDLNDRGRYASRALLRRDILGEES
jgi:hypothetical protein